MNRINVIGVAVAAALLSACGTSHLSKDITPDGFVDGELVFPDKAGATLKEGVFPNPAGLKQVGPGVTKKQLAALVGWPHFREGVFGVREWDYIFNFRGTRGTYATCQYKVIFSEAGEAQSFFPYPEACTGPLADMEVTPAEADQINGTVSISGSEERGPEGLGSEPAASFNLSADTLFEFNSAMLSASGVAAVREVAARIKASGLERRVRVEGHTDRIGGAVYNYALSERRASAVRDVLVQEGLAGAVETAGRGMDVPKVQCPEQARAALIACLAPNRRVVVSAHTKG